MAENAILGFVNSIRQADEPPHPPVTSDDLASLIPRLRSIVNLRIPPGVDPTDGVTPVDRVNPLVDALGADVGVRSAVLPNLQLTASLWTLRLDSELLFVGDAGITEASRESERRAAGR